MIRKAFKIIRMWAGSNQTQFMKLIGLNSRSFLSELESSKIKNMPYKYVVALGKHIDYDLFNDEVVSDLLNNKIPPKYSDANRIRRYDMYEV